MPYLQINDRYNSHNNISFNSTIANGATVRLDTIRTHGSRILLFNADSDREITYSIYYGLSNFKYGFNKDTGLQNTNPDNLNDYKLGFQDTIPANEYYSKEIPIRFAFIYLELSNNSGGTATINFIANSIEDTTYEPVGIRDETLTLGDYVMNTRNTTNFLLDVADGNLSGYEVFSMNTSGELTLTEKLLTCDAQNSQTGWIDTDATYATRDITIYSTLNFDRVGSTGAHQVKITGVLSGTGKEATENINLNGTTKQTLANRYRAINKAEVIKAERGQLQTNAGDIIITQYIISPNTNPEFMCVIPIGESLSTNCLYRVPTNKILYITKIQINSGCDDDGILYINKFSLGDDGAGNKSYVKSVEKKYPLHAQQHLQTDLIIKILGDEYVSISQKCKANIITGDNLISVNLFGYMKDFNLIAFS
mgnify:FL=1